VITIADPVSGETVYFTLPGLNFGLNSAPLASNRYPRIAVMLARRFLGICLDNFYDNFCVCEPDFTRDSGQRCLSLILKGLGLPLAESKHKPMRLVFTFHGVVADFSAFRESGWVTLGIAQERGDGIADEIESVLHSNLLPEGAAAKLSGRLMFATSWACGHIGRAVSRPIYDQAVLVRSAALLPSVRGALAFLLALLRRPGGLPPRTINFGLEARPTVRSGLTPCLRKVSSPASLGSLSFQPSPSAASPS